MVFQNCYMIYHLYFFYTLTKVASNICFLALTQLSLSGIRISFTFRKILQGECDCNYKSKCDSYNKRITESDIEDVTASQLEKLHVHEVYEHIATHFSDTRHKPWPNVQQFVQSFETGSILIDIGCGNGKYLGDIKNSFGVSYCYLKNTKFYVRFSFKK